MCFWPYTFRRAAKFWVAWLERYGGDFLIGKLPRSASPQEYQDLSDALAAMIQDSIAAIPDDGSVEVLASGSKGGSSDAHERFLLYWRGEITIALLGSNQGMETNATNASATASLDVARDIRDGDARMVESVVNQLIAWTCAINWPSVKPPVWTLREQEEIDTARPTRDKILVDCGVKFSRDYWLRTYDLDDSDIEDQSETTATVPVIAQPDDNPQAQQQAAEQAATPEPALAASNITAPDSVDIQTAKMSNQAAPTVDDWLARVRRDLDAYVKAGRSMADFAAHVLTMYPKLQSADLANIMGEAMAASELAGRYELAQEAHD
jgi:phage gp29-like protein